MLRACLAGCATALLVACPAPRGAKTAEQQRDDRVLRIHVAKLEAARAGGLPELAQLGRDGDDASAALALRALGRVDLDVAARLLIIAAPSPDAAAAAAGLGLASSLSEPSTDDRTRRTDALLAAYRTVTDHQAAIIEALGRAGDGRAIPALTAALGSTAPDIAVAGGLALGRFGRRKLSIDPAARSALVVASRAPDRDLRYAATYGLRYDVASHDEIVAMRGHDPVAAALAARIADADPEIRAVAILGLARRGEAGDAQPALEQALRDPDWRVAVEAARALAAKDAPASGPDAVAASVPRWLGEMARDPRAAHVVLESLHALAELEAPSPVVLAMLHGFAAPASAPPIVRGWLACLALSARARHADATLADVASCGHGDLPDHLRLPIVAELITSGAGDAAGRRAALGALFAHADPRVRASGFAALAGTWNDGTADDHRAAIAMLAAAIAAPDITIAGSALDAVPALAAKATPADLVELDAAIVARATHELDPELASSLFEQIGERKLASGVAACRAGLAGHPVRARAAATCLRALGEPVPEAKVDATKAPATDPPPVDVTTVIGKSVRWHLQTTRGEVVIALRPDVAPWAVASIVALTQKGFYDHQELHRVVPDFVVQGGDPTETGQGGPGYSLPAEPASGADGPGFVAGGVGMADSGPDSGGSQWFIMHSRAPHLDGRYTWVGNVLSGQKSADSLVIGDRVEKATVEITESSKPRP